MDEENIYYTDGLEEHEDNEGFPSNFQKGFVASIPRENGHYRKKYKSRAHGTEDQMKIGNWKPMGMDKFGTNILKFQATKYATTI